MARVQRFEVDLALAERIGGSAVRAASTADAVVSVAVVDGGGHLVWFARMDGAEIAGPVLAVDKAYSAVANRCSTAELTGLVAPGGPLAGMYAAGAGRFVSFPGGLPLWDGDRVVGGVGVSGGTADQDAAAAAAGCGVFDATVGRAQ